MGTHLRVLSESYPMNTNIDGTQKSLGLSLLDESSLSIGRVNVSEGHESSLREENNARDQQRINPFLSNQFLSLVHMF